MTTANDRASPPPPFDERFRAELRELFRWRRDVRRFRPDPIPDDEIEALLEILDWAPSVGLSQPWRLVSVDDPGRRAEVRASFEQCNTAALADQSSERAGLYARLKLAGLDEAPRHLAVFCLDEPDQGHGLGRMTMPETTLYSTLIAVHTLWLAARAAGLGIGWVSILDPERVTAVLDVPPTWSLVAYLCVGYPQADHATPELERGGWEHRRSPGQALIQR